MRKIQITLHRDGTQKVEVVGACGPECLEFTRELENRLGKPIRDRVLKPEYELRERESEKEREKEG